MNTNFHKDLSLQISRNNIGEANAIIMTEVGNAIVHHRADFVDLLINSDVPADAEMADAYLLELYINNIQKKDLLIGTAFMVNSQNKTLGADGGQEEISNEGVQKAYKVMTSNFINSPTGKEIEEHRFDWINDWVPHDNEKMSEFWGAAIAGAKNLVGKKRGTLDAAAAQQKAKSDIAKSVIAKRTAQVNAATKAKNAKSKNLRIGLIVGGSVVGLTVIGLVIYLIKKNK